MGKRWKAFTEPMNRDEREFIEELIRYGYDPLEAAYFLRKVFDYSERYVWEEGE
jgi:hypothetical protein